MKKLLFATALPVLALVGCATGRVNYDIGTAADVARDTVTRGDEFDTVITYGGPAQHVLHDGSFNGGLFPVNQYRLRGWKGKDGTIVGHQLYMIIKYSGDWQLYTRASFEGGKTEDLVEIDRSVVDCTGRAPCSLREVVGLPLSDEFLRDHAVTGFRVRVEGRTPAHVFFAVPPTYIQGYLSVIGGS